MPGRGLGSRPERPMMERVRRLRLDPTWLFRDSMWR